MATITWNSNNTSISGFNVNSAKSKTKFWADDLEEFSTNLNDKNAFANNDGKKFFAIKRSEDDFSKT